MSRGQPSNLNILHLATPIHPPGRRLPARREPTLLRLLLSMGDGLDTTFSIAGPKAVTVSHREIPVDHGGLGTVRDTMGRLAVRVKMTRDEGRQFTQSVLWEHFMAFAKGVGLDLNVTSFPASGTEVHLPVAQETITIGPPHDERQSPAIALAAAEWRIVSFAMSPDQRRT